MRTALQPTGVALVFGSGLLAGREAPDLQYHDHMTFQQSVFMVAVIHQQLESFAHTVGFGRVSGVQLPQCVIGPGHNSVARRTLHVLIIILRHAIITANWSSIA